MTNNKNKKGNISKFNQKAVKQIEIGLKIKPKSKNDFIFFSTLQELFLKNKEILVIIPEILCMKGFIKGMIMPHDKKSDLEINVLSYGTVLIEVDNIENKKLKKEAIILGLDRYCIDGKTSDYDLKIIGEI